MGSGRQIRKNIMGGGGNLVKLYSAWRGKGWGGKGGYYASYKSTFNLKIKGE